jgi:hypothetical protein
MSTKTRRSNALGTLLLLLISTVSLAQDVYRREVIDRAEVMSQFGWAVATGDFNGDGRDDLAVGAPRSRRSNVVQAGRVCLYFSLLAGAPVSNSVSCITQGSGAEPVDNFGYSLAFGDFNDDGFDDLAVGTPYEDVANFVNAGVVQVYMGNASRSLSPGQYSQGMPFRQGQRMRTLKEEPEPGDRFGQALAVGDFNGDGFDDLAIGVPGEDFLSPYLVGNSPILLADAGIVQVLYGDYGGLGVSDQVWRQGVELKMGQNSTAFEVAEANDQFGYALATGRFHGSFSDDLAIGVPFEDLPGLPDAGVVQVMYSSPGRGLRRYETDLYDQNRTQRWGWNQSPSELNDRFGFAVAGGDMNGDGIDDLAIGVPGEDFNRGAVHILNGGIGLLSDTVMFWSSMQYLHQTGDELGYSVTFGDLNGDSIDDLVVGVPGDDYNRYVSGRNTPVSNAGSVRVTYGEEPIGEDFMDFDARPLFPFTGSPARASDAEAGDKYGSSVAVGDFNGDGIDDLASGVPFEDVLRSNGSYLDGGAVEVMPGSRAPWPPRP